MHEIRTTAIDTFLTPDGGAKWLNLTRRGNWVWHVLRFNEQCVTSGPTFHSNHQMLFDRTYIWLLGWWKSAYPYIPTKYNEAQGLCSMKTGFLHWNVLLEFLIRILDFYFYFFKLQYELTFLINTVCKHQQSYSRGVTADGKLFNSFLQITALLPTALILTDWT